ncbi:MAG: glycosyltransferase family 2 protein, partial [Candidatus Hydrogenedentes bacterium]|nr:glycosyltransferase family 2 protein [Candidatus Hydrogenedentota bacterium]
MEHVSICILTCDRTEQLEILLASLTAISCRPLEVIVVDNGSTDDTARLVSSDYPDVIYLKQTENIGTAGRNVAMNAATGEIIVALDDDLIGICDDSIEFLIDNLVTHGVEGGLYSLGLG